MNVQLANVISDISGLTGQAIVRAIVAGERNPRKLAALNASGQTGVYYDEGGHPMLGSALVRDPKFQDRVVAETRALLSTILGQYGVDNNRQPLGYCRAAGRRGERHEPSTTCT
jgi:hypothetical protein